MTELVDTGFDAVAAGETWVAPEVVAPQSLAPVDNVIAPAIDEAIDTAYEEVTATVIGLTPAGVQAAKALVALPKLEWPDLARLAREMAMNIKERSVILQEFKLSDAQYDFLESYNEFYREAYKNACREWHAPLTTQERITVEAAAILEDGLLTLGARMQNKGEGLPGVVEAYKLFAKIAKVDVVDKGTAAPGERFSINIDLGGDKSVTINASAIAPPDPS